VNGKAKLNGMAMRLTGLAQSATSRVMARLHRWASRLLRRIPSTKLGLARYWRDVDLMADADVVFVSFPKSGRTFVRVMLARLYQQQFGIDEREVLKFATLKQAGHEVPRLLFTHGGDAMRRPDRVKVNASHFAGRKVVLLARHPGDVAVSRYHHLKHRSVDPARQRLAAQPIEEFVWTAHGGIPSIVAYLNQWAQLSRERSDVLIVRYEDFLAEPQATLRRLADFIGLAPSDAGLADAAEFASFDNLKQREREGYFQSSDRFGAGRDASEGSFKVRSGRSGGFRKALSEGNQARVEAYVADHLDPLFGYSGD
jgi:hypothetical protein